MNRIVHIEIPAPDLDRAGEFYSKVFGWKVEPEEETDYVTWSTGEDELGGGFVKNVKPSTDGVLAYLEVQDIAAKLAEIEDAGGKMVKEKTKISEEYGYYAEFLDVSGNKLGLWSRR